ncbi:DUF2400 domain-containing protein [bacterium]|nr:DUF2400 domain-containing protein [bacterium]
MKPTQKQLRLKNSLESLYLKYNKREYLNWDPLGLLDASLCPFDFEIVSLLAAGLAYGRVEQSRKSLTLLLQRLGALGVQENGSGLRKFLEKDFDKRKLNSVVKGWKHRLNTHFDIVELFGNLHSIFQSNKSIAELFQRKFDSNPKLHLENFCEALAPMTKSKNPGTGASWFAASPARGSSCKRFLLWLKWMIRKDEIDTGLWQSEELLNPQLPRPCVSRLFIPVDTHLYKWAIKNGATKRKNISWKMSEELTAFLLKICPEDPVRYDFAICHQGIMEFRKLD